MSKFIVWGTRAHAVLVLCAITAIALPAQTLTTLFSFDGTDGQYPAAALVQGADGNFYGTTTQGGANGQGTIFKIAPSGKLTPLYSFCPQSGCPDGHGPNGLILASDGNFYGTTYYGANPGTYDFGSGTVFKITPSGAFTTVYSFCSQGGCGDGANPLAGLIQAADGDFYGTTLYGGAYNLGTVFKITPNGTLTTLTSSFGAGELPEAGLVQATNGDFYGTTFDPGFGTLFKMTPGGTLTTLVSFGAFGGFPTAALVQGPGGYLYGTTSALPGNLFKMTPSGTLTLLYSFCSQSGCTDGEGPSDALVPATDGNLYGTTSGGGGTNCRGTVFKITPSGTLTTLYSFCSGSYSMDGGDPSGLLQATNGDFYGVTYHGGAHNDGTVYSLSVGLGPFAETVPQYGQVGRVIRILGNGLTGATAVTFNGAPAAFAIVAATEIRATVPAGATTGKIQVTTPAGTLLSAGPFTVLP